MSRGRLCRRGQERINLGRRLRFGRARGNQEGGQEAGDPPRGRYRCGLRGFEPSNPRNSHQRGPSLEPVAARTASGPDQAIRPGTANRGHAQSRLPRDTGRRSLPGPLAPHEGPVRHLWGLPDTIEDDWIENVEKLEEMMDQYIHLRQQATDVFEMRYKETIDPDKIDGNYVRGCWREKT